jgi:putative oxidoreductase
MTNSMNIDRGWGLTILRIVVGIVFLMHGGQKLFVHGLKGVTGGFSKMGIPLPGVSAVVVTFVEFLGGLALILGVFTTIAAVLLAIDMLVAILKVHAPHGFFLQANGFEYALTLLAASVAIALAGPGRAALERAMGVRKR